MAINFLSLEKSEIELKENFIDLLKQTQSLHEKLYDYLVNNIPIDEEKLEDFLELKTRINDLKRDIRDDSIWIISKDQPRASHLRFIIAILYSIKDNERISQYAYNVAKWINKYPLSLNMRSSIPLLLKKSNLFFQKIINVVSSDSVNEYETEIKKDALEYRIFYKEFVKGMIKKNNLNSDESIDMYFNISLIFKCFERTVDHLLEIFKNFMLISW